MVDPAIDSGGLTDVDYDDYMSGVYDRDCSLCDGKRITFEPDWAQVSDEDAGRIMAHEEEEENFARVCAAERAMGC